MLYQSCWQTEGLKTIVPITSNANWSQNFSCPDTRTACGNVCYNGTKGNTSVIIIGPDNTTLLRGGRAEQCAPPANSPCSVQCAPTVMAPNNIQCATSVMAPCSVQSSVPAPSSVQREQADFYYGMNLPANQQSPLYSAANLSSNQQSTTWNSAYLSSNNQQPSYSACNGGSSISNSASNGQQLQGGQVGAGGASEGCLAGTEDRKQKAVSFMLDPSVEEGSREKKPQRSKKKANFLQNLLDWSSPFDTKPATSPFPYRGEAGSGYGVEQTTVTTTTANSGLHQKCGVLEQNCKTNKQQATNVNGTWFEPIPNLPGMYRQKIFQTEAANKT